MAISEKKDQSAPKNQTLDDLLLALQKSISRVNKASSNVDSSQARALITGTVSFNLTCKCEMLDTDKLIVNDEGSIELSLAGKIDTDIGVIRMEEEKNASSK
ncbi:hypothetical protein [uncultured Alteromonas sp.]|jgi:hypothetical protein|uniref:hypothetical protein n=1 Tax=uncultured Alteromonas sp. TaxID=179113 RepID=UPI0030EEFD85|tara:strand:+ start:1833 stop:2138 length:306 start_codon:yes stop_codon:yes gene_type:complete